MKSLTDVSSQSHLSLFQENKGNQEFCPTLRDLDPNAFLFFELRPRFLVSNEILCENYHFFLYVKQTEVSS